uniref:MICOS complex subunit MIC60 n=1 Tax=Strongyloides venezuelensis TaxID=75913 RepID=A0A0K0FXT0_STRVS
MKKFVFYTGTTTAAVAGGTIATAHLNPKARSTVEEWVPKSKEVFNLVLGPSESTVKNVKENITSSLTVIPKKIYPTRKTEKPEIKEEPEKLPSKKPIEISPIEVKQKAVGNETSKDSLITKKNNENKDLENKLIKCLTDAQDKIHVANSAKIFTCEGYKNYAKVFKQAIDDGADANWNSVTEAKKHVDKLAADDDAAEAAALKLISNLEKVIDEGKNNPLTATNPLIYNAAQTVYQLKAEIDRTNLLIKKTSNEIDVLKNYKDLVEESKNTFLEEVKAIAPSIDTNATGSTLTEKELNNLLVHAHLKVSKLNKRLIEQELRERENVALAVKRQRELDEAIAREKLQQEIDKISSMQNINKEAEIAKITEKFNKEWEERLSREKSAHADHLEKVIRTQKEIHDIENSEKVNEAIQKERAKHSQEFEMAISQLEGIEHALDKRAVLDIENRKAKQCWLASKNLLESIVYGVKAGDSMEKRRKPLEKELKTIKTIGKGDRFIEVLVDSFDKDVVKNGVYTQEDLKNIFQKVYKVSKRVAKVDDNGGSIMKYISSFIQSFFTIEIGREYSRNDKIDINNISTYDILERVNYFVSREDFETAVKLAQLLKGESRNVANGWIKDTQNFLNTRLLAELLVARAVVISACSIY